MAVFRDRLVTAPASGSKSTSNDSSATGTGAPSTLGDTAPAIDNRELLRWMFKFVRPVKWLCVVACIYLTIGIAAEVMTTRQIGRAIDVLKKLHSEALTTAQEQASPGFWHWIVSGESQAIQLRHSVLVLLGLVAVMSIFRYLREVTNSKFSMNMVYYIREAVYDQLQRVGFGFHDSLSSGALINRALSDLQNVRAFVQTALLLTLEIVLVVVLYIALLIFAEPVHRGAVAAAVTAVGVVRAAVQQEGSAGRESGRWKRAIKTSPSSPKASPACTSSRRSPPSSRRSRNTTQTASTFMPRRRTAFGCLRTSTR